MSLHRLTASALAGRLERGETTSEALIDALVARAEETEPHVRGFSQRLFARAAREARVCDEERRAGQTRSPLHGLPLTVKDNIAVEGTRRSVGLVAGSRDVSREDALVVAAARRAGAIVLGKSNVPQGLLSMHCDNAVYGRTSNPWSPGHVTGGSSAGEGALLASGASVMGIGSDLGGSIRFPAAFCGVAGFKPTQDRWSNRGTETAIPGQEFVRAQLGPMARSVDDLRMMFDALDPAWQRARDWRVPPEAPARAPGPLRIGYFDDDGISPANPAMRRVLREVVTALSREGVETVEVEPWLHEPVVHHYLAAVSSDGMRTLRARFGDERPAPGTRLMWRLGTLPRFVRNRAATVLRLANEPTLAGIVARTGERDVGGYWALVAERERLRSRYEDAWRRSGIDVVLTPAAATPAVPVGMEHDASLMFSWFCVYNVFGMPAGVVPVGRVDPRETHVAPGREQVTRRFSAIAARSAGLPVAVQVAGPRHADREVLDVMARVERIARARSDYPTTPVGAAPLSAQRRGRSSPRTR